MKHPLASLSRYGFVLLILGFTHPLLAQPSEAQLGVAADLPTADWHIHPDVTGSTWVSLTTTTTFDGDQAIRLQTDFSNSSVSGDLVWLTLNQKGKLVFWWKGDSDNSSNAIEVWMDSAPNHKLSKKADWIYHVLNIAPQNGGSVTVAWRLVQNLNSAGGYLDRVRFIPDGAPVLLADPIALPGIRNELQGSPIAPAEGGHVRTHQVLFAGDTLRLEALVEDATGMTFQWFRDGAALPGQQSRIMEIPSAQASDSGGYKIRLQQGGQVTESHETAIEVRNLDPLLSASGLNIGDGLARTTADAAWTPAPQVSPNAVSSPLLAANQKSALAFQFPQPGTIFFDLDASALPTGASVIATINGHWFGTWPGGTALLNARVLVSDANATVRWEVMNAFAPLAGGAVRLQNVQYDPADVPVFAVESRTVASLLSKKLTIGATAVSTGPVSYQWLQLQSGVFEAIPDATSAFREVSADLESRTYELRATTAFGTPSCFFTVNAELDAPVTLTPGDLAITRFNRDTVSLLALRSIAQGTKIVLTDRSWISHHERWYEDEPPSEPGGGFLVFTFPDDLMAGNHQTVKLGPVVDIERYDHLYIFQGDSSNPTFLFGVHFAPDWYAWADVPRGLDLGLTAVSVGVFDLADTEIDAAYGGSFPTNSTPREILKQLFDFDSHSPMPAWERPANQRNPVDLAGVSTIAGSPGLVTFDESDVIVFENAGTASVPISRRIGSAGDLSVVVRATNLHYTLDGGTVPATAQQGVHFQFPPTTVTWLNGHGGTQLIPVPLVADPAESDRRSFWIEIDLAAGLTIEKRRTRIHIIDGQGNAAHRAAQFPAMMDLAVVEYDPEFQFAQRDPVSFKLTFDVRNRGSRKTEDFRVIARSQDEATALLYDQTFIGLDPGDNVLNPTPFFPVYTTSADRIVWLELWENTPSPEQSTLVRRMRVKSNYVTDTGNPPSGGGELTEEVRDGGQSLGPTIDEIVITAPAALLRNGTGSISATGRSRTSNETFPIDVTWKVSPQTEYAIASGQVSASSSAQSSAILTAELTGDWPTARLSFGTPAPLSASATIVLNYPPTISDQPDNTTLIANDNATFAIAVSGKPTPSIQWQRSTDGGTTFNNLTESTQFSGTTSAMLTIVGVTTTMNGQQFRARAANGVGTDATSNLATLAVNPPAPGISSLLTASGTVGSPFSYVLTASNGPMSFNATGLPPGLGVNLTTGEITGTPTTAGTTNVTISATNTTGTGIATLEVTIVSAAAPQQPSTPTAGPSAFDSLVAQWSAVAGATGYRLDVATDATFQNFVPGYEDLDVGAATSRAIIGLRLGTYFVRVRAVNAGGASSSSSTFSMEVGSRLLNLSTRGLTSNADPMIVGFYVGGAPKTLLIRIAAAILAQLGVPGTLPNPRLRLVDGTNATIASNDDWNASDPAVIAATTASGAGLQFTPGSVDSVLVASNLAAGSYTAIVESVTGASGIVLVELYEIDEVGRLINISTRGFTVASGSDVMTPGTFIGPTSKRLLIRVAGETLGQFIPGTLTDPILEIYDGDNPGTPMLTNDNWDGNNAALIATWTQGDPLQVAGLAFANGTRDAAVLVVLPKNNSGYTVLAKGKNGASGTVLVEIYEVP